MTSQNNSPQTPNQKKQVVLSPFKSSTSTSPFPTQNRYTPLTPPPAYQTYSSLVKNPVVVSHISTPNKTTIVSPSIQNISPFSQKASTSSSSSKAAHSSYTLNPNAQVIKILEDHEMYLQSKGFHVLIDFLFPKNSLFIGNTKKPRDYYQAILIDTGSIKVIHNQNSANSSQIDFSKVQNFQILSIQDWKARPYTDKTLSNYPANPSYNYYDYQDAWFNFLYLRSYTHSWFLFFDKSFNCNYPRWFVKWFKYMGNIPETFPQRVKEGFIKFKEIFVQDIPEFEYLLQFSMLFKILWILSWSFTITPASGLSPPLLQRTARVKWWDKLPHDQIEKMTIQGVSNYYSINFGVPASITTTPRPLELDEEEEIAQFMAANSKEEIRRLIKEIKQNSPDSSIATQDIQDSLFQDSQDPYADVKL